MAGLGGGHTYTLGGASSATCTWAYDFTAASNFEGTIPVTATDRATNPSTGSGQAPGTATFTLVRDGTPPAVAVTATVQAEDIHVTWAASDTGSDLGACRLEVDTGDGSQEELSTSCEGSYIYTDVEPGQTCIFHLTATDHVGNQASAEATSGLPRVTKYFYHGGKRVAMRSGGQVYYLHGDHLGSASLTTNESGEVVSRQLYHPFGTVRYSEGTLPTDFTYTGQRAIAGTGLVYMHARYYHAALARFTQADTVVPNLANPQEWNRYGYCVNNPTRYIDPRGHQIEPPEYQPFGIAHTGTTGPYVLSEDTTVQYDVVLSSSPQGGYTAVGDDYAEWARTGVDLQDGIEAASSFANGATMLRGGFDLAEGSTYAGQTIVYGTASAKTAAGLVPQFTHAGATHAALAGYTNVWRAAGNAAKGQALGLVVIYGADVYDYGWGSKADVGLGGSEFASALTADTAIQLGPPAAGALIGTAIYPGAGTVIGAGGGIIVSIFWGAAGREATIVWVDENIWGPYCLSSEEARNNLQRDLFISDYYRVPSDFPDFP